MSEEELCSSSDKEEERIHTATRPTDVRAVIARLNAAIERCRVLTASIDAISSMGQDDDRWIDGTSTPEAGAHPSEERPTSR